MERAHADNVTDTEWRAKYQPKGTRSSDTAVQGQGAAGSETGASTEVLAGVGEGARKYSLAEKAREWRRLGRWMVGEA